MKSKYLVTLTIASLILVACSSSKKAKTTVVTNAPATNNTTSPSKNEGFMFIKPGYGMHVPGDPELLASQAKFADATLIQLKQGHSTYTEGACIKCHGAGSIYDHTNEQWVKIIDEMAMKANITEEEKEAVYRYVLSIKATQPK